VCNISCICFSCCFGCVGMCKLEIVVSFAFSENFQKPSSGVEGPPGDSCHQHLFFWV